MEVYADNAATTKMSRAAVEAMIPYFEEVYGNPSSLHNPGRRAAQGLYFARKTIADTLGVMPGEIYFTSGGSEADNQAVISAAEAGERCGKKHIISSKAEHHAVLNALKRLEKRGFEITLLDVYENGIVHTEDVKNAIRPDTALVTIMYANNEIGTIQPVEEIGKICRENGVLFHTDAVQAAGHINIDMENTDMLSLSAHKFRGPKGIGVLYAKRGIQLVNLIEGGRQERGKRGGTENTAAIAGMAAAFKEAVLNTEKNSSRVIPLRDRLTEGLTAIPGTVFNGDKEKRLPGIVNVCFEGIEGETLLMLLNERGIYVSSGSACTSGSLEASHVLLAVGREEKLARGSLRISLSEENTAEETEYMINTIRETVEYLRKIHR